MKINLLKSLALFLCLLFLFSCNSLPVSYSAGESWSVEKSKTNKTIKLAGVSIDRSGGWDSLEKEVTVLAPLYFWEHGYRPADDTSNYIAHISLREREFSVGWNTRRSLSIEVRIWLGNTKNAAAIDAAPKDASAKNTTIAEMPYLSGELPVAAGRIVLIGNRSFSSSQTTGKMLYRAIAKTVRAIPRVRKEK
jgi:hypothetical protein